MDMFDNDKNNSDWVFNFESDHLALRGNRAYSKILRTLALLEAQKIKIHGDIEEIILRKNKYLREPSDFVNEIVENKFCPPNYMCITPIPDVGQTSIEHFGDNNLVEKLNTDVKVRGRTFDQTKPETFNQLWTCEEQRRLEQLLMEYPVEPVEMRRFSKIALALGSRTPQQVASRVQKFFKKLHSVGMPVPGRIPKSKKSVFSKSKHFYKNMPRRSTFFPAHDVPVNIPEEDILSTEFCSSNSDFDYKLINTTTTEKQSTEFKKKILNVLQIVRNEKLASPTEQLGQFDEICDYCMESLTKESQWICNTCCCHINLCGDCIIYQVLSKSYAHINHDVILNKNLL